MPILRKCLAPLFACCAVLTGCGGESVDRVETVAPTTTTARTLGHYNEVVRMQELLDRAQEDRAAGLAFSVAVAEFADAAGRESVTLGDGNAPSRREDDGAVTDEPRPTASVPSLEPCGGDLPPCWVAQKESGGSYTAYNPTGCGGRGCYGKWQFSGEWAGKLGLPEDLATATPEQQDAAARELWRNGAGCSNWGACG